MKNISVFQVIILSVFGFFVLAGFVVASLYSRDSQVGGSNLVYVTVWGTLPQSEMKLFLDRLSSEQLNLKAVYSEKSSGNYDREIVEAIASGQGPDIIIISQADLMKNLNRLFVIPYQFFSARDFKDSFLEIGELFTAGGGFYALPFSIDPMIMYWNRDMFSSAGLANPPKFWDEMYYYTEKLAKKDSAGNILTAAVALGDYPNIAHAKSILAGMFLQKGGKLSYWSEDYTRFSVDLGDNGAILDGAIDFYTQFSNITKTSYTWNRSMLDSKNLFIGGKLGIYFGLASEIKEIKSKNPNLNFDVAVFPQLRNSSFRVTYGDVYGLAVLKSSKRISSAVQAALFITTRENVSKWAEGSYTPPVRKDLTVPVGDADLAVFQESALISKSWLDPDKIGSDKVFSDMIGAIVSGREEINSARGRATNQLRALVPRL